MSSALNCHISGGESKLINCVIKYAKDQNYKGVVCFIDAGFGTSTCSRGKLKFSGVTKTPYCYTTGSKMVSKKSIGKITKNKTEEIIAKEKHLYKVNLTPSYIFTCEF